MPAREQAAFFAGKRDTTGFSENVVVTETNSSNVRSLRSFIILRSGERLPWYPTSITALFSSGEKRKTVKPRFNEPLYNEVLGVTNEIFCPSNSKIYEKEPR